MKIIILALAFLFSSGAFAADEWRRGYVYNPASASGSDIWFGPGGQVEAGAAARGKTVWSQGGGGTRAVESGAVALRDGRAVTLTAQRTITAASVFAGAAKFASGPYGLAALIAVPFFVEWVAGDNAEHIRIAPSLTGLEKIDSTLCTVAPCYYYNNTSIWYSPPMVQRKTSIEACMELVSYVNSTNWGAVAPISMTGSTETTCSVRNSSGSWAPTISVAKTSRAVDDPQWKPASMDDIAPYMTPRTPPAMLVPYLLDKGITFPATEDSITGPSPALAPLPESKRTTEYAKPADIVSSPVITNGNPFGLPSNTPTVTSSSTGSKSLSPTSSSTIGPNPSPTPHTPVVTPTQTETISNYDPVTDKTTSTTTTKQDAAKQETTTTTITNITNTTNTSTATTTITNITNITNTTINQPIGPPIEDVKTGPQPEVDPRSECEKNPDTIGCSKYGTPVAEDQLVKETVAVTVTPVSFAGGATCPSPISFNVAGHQYAVEYTPLCEKLAVLKFLFLAMAGFIAAYVVANMFKV